VTFHSVPAGEYDITASVIGPDGHSTALAPYSSDESWARTRAVVRTAVE
jgi:hypothetical protein